jgi:hypothetical protein
MDAGFEQGAGEVDRVGGRDEPPVQHLVEKLVPVKQGHLQKEIGLADRIGGFSRSVLELLEEPRARR